MAGFVAYMIEPSLMAWSSVPLPVWLRWIGLPIGVAAGILMIATLRTLGPNLTDTVVTRAEHTLITTGPYRRVRHPFYLAFLLALIANSLVSANAYIAATGATAFALITLRTKIEEAKLIDRFGDEYRNYISRTGRFFPRFE